MKKLFLLIPAFLLSLAVSAATINVSPGSNSLKAAVTDASDGDVLVLENGTYIETGNFDFKKSITIQAKEGATPEIFNTYYFRIEGGADVTFQGIKFNGSSASDHCVRSHNNSTGEEDIQFIDCEFTNYKSYVIYTQRDARRWNSITIRNCTFYNNKSCAVRIDEDGGEHTKQSCNSLTIENSTFANFTGANDVIYYNAPDAEHTTSLTMDHCTFYNHPNCAVNWQKSTNLTITNCIFAQPSTVSNKSVECVGGTITKCLSYKTGGYSSAATPTGNLTSNPYFVNTTPGSYDFSVASFSPAHNAGTDNKDLGDYLRWNSDDSAHPTTINLSAGTDAIKAAVAAAWPGDEIVLAEGTYNESASIELDKNLTIKAADGASPIVVPVKDFAISNGVEVTIQGIKFDGTSQTASNFIYAADNSANNLTVEGCEFYNIGNRVIYAGSDKKLVCTVDDCYFHNNTKSCIYIENTAALNLTVTNSTFANCSTSSRSTVESKTASGVVTVDHCTFYNCTVESTDYGMIRFNSSNTTVSNNIFAMPSSTDGLRAIYFPDDENSYEIRHCLVYNLTKDSNTGIRRGTKTNCLFIDPRFDDLANNKYSYDEDSPARAAATDGTDLGDPSWYTDRPIYSTDFTSPYTFVATRAVRNAYCTLDANNHLKTKNPSTIEGDAYSVATWQIQSTRAVAVKATINMASDSKYGHNYKVAILDSEDNQIGELSKDWLDTHEPFDLNGLIYIPAAGVYTIKLSNIASGSSAIVEGITLTADGGNVTNIAADANTSLNVADAWFNTGATRADGTITYSSWNSADSWIKWNIATSETKFYDVSMRINTTNAHRCTVAIYEDEAADPVATVQESHSEATGDALDIALGRVNLVGGKNYVVKVTNPVSGSAAKIASVTFAPVAASATELPNTLAFSNAVLSARAHVTDGKLYFAPIGDTNPEGEWARWAVTTDHAGLFLFTMGVNSTNSQSYKISIYNDLDTRIDLYEAKPSSGAQTLKHYFSLPAGNYSVQVENTTAWSNGYLTSLVVTEPGVVTLDENAENNASWASKVNDGNTYDVQIIRSFRGGMNNTFCLPFAVSSSQCKEVFGNDVEIYTLGEATIEDYILNLTVNPASDIYPGTPVLIKPARDIVNPVFTDVKFTAYTASATTKTNANFVGSFVKTPLTASDNLLYVGPENKVFFLSVDYDMPGMRAWFVIHDVPAALGSPKALRSARIIEKEQITTSILNVETSGDAARKVLYNGQIVIIRGNEMYNMQGQHIQ